MLVEGYCEETKIKIEKYQDYIDEGAVLEGFPIWPSMIPCSKKLIDLREVDLEIEKVKD